MRRPGRVVLLNGPSSSGKSSIAEAMLDLLPGPWFHVPVDAVNAMRSTPRQAPLDDEALAEVLERTRRGYHRVLAALAEAGNDVIADYPLSEPWRLDDLLVVLDGIDVTLVDVVCSNEELERRERARADRPRGLASSQRVYEHGDRDVTVDSSAALPAECAWRVVDSMGTVARPKAFDRLRAARGAGR
ncbi:unannotated protein [freshwater metagenome]|uniref:Unannotated protein n=1 Tax=freshwater metagenome TaxID=449393 RepID=A0A6J7KCT2_9ZZZZ